MIVLRACLTIDPAGREIFLSALREFVDHSRAETDCLTFDVGEDVHALNRFIVLEVWATHAALDQHEKSSHVATFKAKIGTLVTERETTQVYTVNNVSTL
ncbi:MAG: putative quinol monooxygenase [Aggregatilineales bacterium]